MTRKTLVESVPMDLSLDPAQVDALRVCGRRLASSKTWWGAAPSEERLNSVIRVVPAEEGLWSVRVNDAVGFVAAPGLQLAVEPKIPVSHLLYLFGLSGRFPRLDDQRFQSVAGSFLHEVIAAWFVSATERVLRADLLKDYVPLRESLQFLRGTVHAVSTARAFYGGRLGLDCTHEDFLPDTPLNRLLKAAARRVQMMTAVPVEVRRRAAAVVSRMDDVGDLRPTDFSAGLDRRSSYYEDAIGLARIVLSATGLDWQADERVGWAFLIRTPEMVESGLRTILGEEFGQKRFVKRPIPVGGTAMTLNPDLLAPADGAVGDIKYKHTPAEWSRPDLYQVIAFAHACQAEKAMVSTFSKLGVPCLPQLTVGGTPISHVAWAAEERLTPAAARADWVEQVSRWLTSDQPAADIMGVPSLLN